MSAFGIVGSTRSAMLRIIGSPEALRVSRTVER